MSKLVLALSGWKGSGKSTVADYLSSEYGFTQVSFASRLKDMVSEAYNVDRELFDSPTKKEMPLVQYPVIPSDATTIQMHKLLQAELSSGYWTPRALCILEGSMRRAVHSNYWVRLVLQEMNRNPGGRYVITDMRYKTEADTVRLFYPNSPIIRINRFDNISTQDPSERDMDDYPFDIQLDNRGTHEQLHSQLDNLMRSYLILDYLK